MIKYREVRRGELEEVAALLTEAFREYSFLNIYGENKKNQPKFLHEIQEVGVKAAYKKHLMIVGIQDDKIVSVARIKSPSAPEISLLDFILAGGIKVLLAGGIVNTFGFLNMLKEASAVCHSLPVPVWYLEVFAVSASCQGQGVGTRMFKECIIPYIQKRGGGLLTLITNTEQNRVFYKKNGFEEFHEMVIRRKSKEVGNWSYRMEIK
jgi:GNAT superfamily N-acetyltransferase